MNQKTATYQAIVNVLSTNGIAFEEGMNVGPLMTKELRGQVSIILFQGFRDGTIELEKEFDDSELKSYISGLVSNWIRKDKRLNGDTKYVAKNPGSRVGMGDPQLKALKQLLSQQTDAAKRAEIQGYIDQRTATLVAEKSKGVAINVDALPAELQKYVK